MRTAINKMMKTFVAALILLICLTLLMQTVYAEEESSADYNIEHYNFYLLNNEFTYYPFDRTNEFINTNILNSRTGYNYDNSILRWNKSIAPQGFNESSLTISVDSVDAGTRIITINPKSSTYSGTVTIPITIKPYKITASDIRIDPFGEPWCDYNGKFQRPEYDEERALDLEVKFIGRYDEGTEGITKSEYDVYHFLQPSEYKVVSQKYKNNKNVGSATVTFEIEFLSNNYEDKIIFKDYKFSIKPPKTKITKITRNNTSFTVKWKKVKMVDKYKVRVYRGSKLIGYKTVESNGNRSYTISGLWRHTKYSVEVETIKKVKGKNYVNYSKTRYVLTK